jgi:tRNA (cmo5U34)-methyltransferase
MTTPLDRKSSTDDIRKRFDNEVDRFSNLDTGQRSAIDARFMLDLVAEVAAACQPSARRVLDLGCGAGNSSLRFLAEIAPLDIDLIDLSASMLERAEARIRSVNFGAIRKLQGDLREVELEDGVYDVVFAAAVLHHLRDDADWERVFEKIWRVAAPGGSVWITDFIRHDSSEVQAVFWKRYGEFLESAGGPAHRETVFAYIDAEDSPRSLPYQLELLARVGFVEVDVLHKDGCFAAFGARKPR